VLTLRCLFSGFDRNVAQLFLCTNAFNALYETNKFVAINYELPDDEHLIS